MSNIVVVIGAGIAGVSSAIWLQRQGRDVVLVDPSEPGEGASFGNAGVLAVSSVVPVTTPGLAFKVPRYVLDPESPLFVLWRRLPYFAPWLIRYLLHANDKDTRRIAKGLAEIVCDSTTQHHEIAVGTTAEKWLCDSNYIYAYAHRSEFEQEKYAWSLRKDAGITPEEIEGTSVSEIEPNLSPNIKFLIRLKDHGFVLNPSQYVKDLAKSFVNSGGIFKKSRVTGFELTQGRLNCINSDDGGIPCDAAVVSAGIWSRDLLKEIGIGIPMQSERGYHILFKNPSVKISNPVMINSGKCVATPMAEGLRCAGVLEFGGLGQPPSKAPLNLIRRKIRETFPDLTWDREIEWSGHRPAPVDSLPLIGEVRNTRVFLAFGHHHIGLTGGPKTGRIVASLVNQEKPCVDPEPYNPNRFL